MLPAQYRLTRRSEISETIRRGARARRGAVVVHAEFAAGSPEPPRAAFAVGKSVGNSVVRHQVVRRLRPLLPPLLDALPPGSRVVVRALPEAATATSGQLTADLDAAFSRLMRDAPTQSPPPARAIDSPAAVVVEGEPETHRGLARVAWIIGTPFRWLLIALVWTYRHTISPILPPTCRYHPSCSAYAFEALQVHGAAKGFVLATWRVLRCNPFTPGGLDPVPARGAWKPDILPDGRPRTPGPEAAAAS